MTFTHLVFALLLAFVQTAPRTSTFTGTISDSECANANHAGMRMGETDAECVTACIEQHGATYVLYDGSVSYRLSDQKAAAAFAARKVTVAGTLDEKSRTIQVQSIAAAK